jgi:predicted transcriptional regulator
MITMHKISYHPNAYLSRKRNVRLGLVARTKILQIIENGELAIKDIEQQTALKYAVILYHLRLLEQEKIVTRKGGKRPYLWALTGAGQKRLVEN